MPKIEKKIIRNKPTKKKINKNDDLRTIFSLSQGKAVILQCRKSTHNKWGTVERVFTKLYTHFNIRNT